MSRASTKAGRRDVARHPEVVAEVAGTDEEHVDAVDRGDLVDRATAGSGLDLHDDEHLVVGPVQRAGVEPEPAGPVVGGHAAVPVRRVAQVASAPRGPGRRCPSGAA